MSFSDQQGNRMPTGSYPASEDPARVDGSPPRYAYEDPERAITPWPTISSSSPYPREDADIINQWPLTGRNGRKTPDSVFTYTSTRRRTSSTVDAGCQSRSFMGLVHRFTGKPTATAAQGEEARHGEAQSRISGNLSAANTGSDGTGQASHGLFYSISNNAILGSLFSSSPAPRQGVQQISGPFNFRHEGGVVGSSGDIILRDLRLPTAHENPVQGENLGATMRAQKESRTTVQTAAGAQDESVTAMQGETSVQNESGIAIQNQSSAQSEITADMTHVGGNVQPHDNGIEHNTSTILMDIRTESRSNNHTSLPVTVPNVISPIDLVDIVESGDLEAGVGEHIPAGGISATPMPCNGSEAIIRAFTGIQDFYRMVSLRLKTDFCKLAGWIEALGLTVDQKVRTLYDTAARFVMTNIIFFFWLLVVLSQMSLAVAIGSFAEMCWAYNSDPKHLIAPMVVFIISVFALVFFMHQLFRAAERRQVVHLVRGKIDSFNSLPRVGKVIFSILLFVAECAALSSAASFAVVLGTKVAGEQSVDSGIILWSTLSGLSLIMSISGSEFVWRCRDNGRNSNTPHAMQGDDDHGWGGISGIEMAKARLAHGISSHTSADGRNNNAAQNSLAPAHAARAHGPRGENRSLTDTNQVSQNGTIAQHPSANMIGIARSDSLISRNVHGSSPSTLSDLDDSSMESFGTEQSILPTALSVASRQAQLVSSPRPNTQSSSLSSAATLKFLPQTVYVPPEIGTDIPAPRPTYNPSKSFAGSRAGPTGPWVGVSGSAPAPGTGGGSGPGPAASDRRLASVLSHTRPGSDDTIDALLESYDRPLWVTEPRRAASGQAVLLAHQALHSHPVVLRPARKRATPCTAVICDASHGSAGCSSHGTGGE